MKNKKMRFAMPFLLSLFLLLPSCDGQKNVPTTSESGDTSETSDISETTSSETTTSEETSTSEESVDLQYSYVISYNTNGGNMIEDDIYVVGDEFILPTPIREGYNFTGWYFDIELTKPFVLEEVNTNVTIYAAYEIKNITIYLDEAIGLEQTSITKQYGDILTYEDFPIPQNKFEKGLELPFLYWREDTTETPVTEDFAMEIKDRYYAFSAIYEEPLIYGRFDISDDGKTYTANAGSAIQTVPGAERDTGFISADITVTKNDYVALICNFADGGSMSPYTSYGAKYYEFYLNTSSGLLMLRGFGGQTYATVFAYMDLAKIKASTASFADKFKAFYTDASISSFDINLKFAFGYDDTHNYLHCYVDNVLVFTASETGTTLADTGTPLVAAVTRKELPHYESNGVGVKSMKAGNAFRNVTVG